ncbi:beta-lactamase/transpeptidase-like protein [Gamsiella multidivaricata]|uniref:beta-lactamase/transpeptidase-like protein n=1 Tax=Gamsiella multidivaricata TaxID=101098 RepID=UPI00221E4550|nr:beta-lactamase/transpeptidase-like protein [Gamsiella multidivaricata]KAG0351611.1 hypothetical protein BGZ54_003177 [Gamsiella multidivaricata]KAI7816077.1 beta-lactamase/transpeptidase-like protein [Gamsiella multidivaricata]
MTIIHESSTSDKEFFEKLPAVLERARIEGGIPGMSVAIMYKGELVFAQGFGKRNRVDPFTEETVSHIASVTKAFTAAAIGELVAEGKVDWDKTPVSEYLPEFELKDPVLTSQLTFADMLAHRTPVPYIDLAWIRNAAPPKVLINQLKHLDMPPKLSPTVNYSNVVYAVAGEAAANVAGMSYVDLITTKIFDPLGLKSAGLSQAEMAKRPNFAMPFTAASFEEAKKGFYEEGYVDEIPMSVAPAGDIYMDVVDLVKWGRVILKLGELDGKQVLSKESILETVTPHNIMKRPRLWSDLSPVKGYGYGWIVDSYKGQANFRHDGSNPGYVTHLALFPDADLVIAHLANIHITNLPSCLFYHIADELLGLPKTEDWLFEAAVEDTQHVYNHFARLAKGDLPERIENQPHSHQLSDYTGEYTHPVYGEIMIRLEEGNSLFMKMSVYDQKLEHYHYESFTTLLHDFTVKFGLLFTFVTGSSGKVDSIKTMMEGIALEFKREEVTETASKEE